MVSFHAIKKSLSPTFSELFSPSMVVNEPVSYASGPTQNPVCYQYVRGAARPDTVLLENVPLDENNEASFTSTRFRKVGNGSSEFVEILASKPVAHVVGAKPEHQLLQGVSTAEIDFLVQSYFQVVHPVFPILDPHAFRSSYESTKVDPLLLTAVCVLCAAWLSTGHGTQEQIDLSGTEGKLWEQLRPALERPTIPVLQAALLLLQGPSQTYQPLSSHLMLAAFDLGLHLDCSEWSIDASEKLARKRLGWALYAQDKWNSLLLGRPPQLTETNWLVPDLSEGDFAAGSEGHSVINLEHGALLFTQLLVLSRLLASILELFYTASSEAQVRSDTTNGLRLVLERAKSVQIKLKDWFAHLSPELKMDHPDEEKVAANGILHLSYFATEIALHRCIINASVLPGTDSYLAHVCRSAAKTRLISAMDFVNRLRSQHFTLSWPLASTANFGLIGSFGALLRATAPTHEEAEFYRARLEEYRWTLGVSRQSAGFLVAATRVLDRSNELLQHVPGKPGMDEFLLTNPHVLGAGAGAGGARTSMANGQAIQSGSFTQFDSEDEASSGEDDLEMLEDGGYDDNYR